MMIQLVENKYPKQDINYIFRLLVVIQSFTNMSQLKEPFFKWAYNHNDIAHPKYSTSKHAIYVTITGTLIFLLVTWIASHLIFTSECQLMRPSSVFFGSLMFIYLVFMMSSRYMENGSVAIYEFLWACNQALLVGAFAMIIQDSHLLRASIVLVSVDQLLWYVDLVGFLFKKKFIIGVAKYIIWPQTTKLRLMTTFHHVWYIPLVLWLTSPSVSQCGLNFEVYFLCCAMSFVLAFIGKISAPKEVIIENIHHKKNEDQKEKTRKVYLNLNLSWQLWKDIKAGFLTKCYEVLPQKLIPFFLSMFWNAGNFIGFIILVLIEHLYK